MIYSHPLLVAGINKNTNKKLAPNHDRTEPWVVITTKGDGGDISRELTGHGAYDTQRKLSDQDA